MLMAGTAATLQGRPATTMEAITGTKTMVTLKVALVGAVALAVGVVEAVAAVAAAAEAPTGQVTAPMTLARWNRVMVGASNWAC
jgi:hypothetical protein